MDVKASSAELCFMSPGVDSRGLNPIVDVGCI